MFYAADNHYGSQTDLGFANTWYVVAFLTKASRDAYVEASDRLSTRAIKAREVKKYGGIAFKCAVDGVLDHAYGA